MCDTTVALANSTANGKVLFAKNSDRDPNEAQLVEMVPAQDHLLPAKVKCTYIEIPQVEHTHQVLLSRPFWIWGAEMGTNEFGLTIGNEAIFTKIPQEKEPGLIGMDLLRLALERARTAAEALKVITGLLAEYGQSGNCGFAHPFQYHNGFLLVDPQEAWVLETAGREWAAEKVTSVRSISNAISIGSHFDLASENLVRLAVDKKWCKSDKDFDFGRCYSDFIFTTFSDGRARQACTTGLLQSGGNSLTTARFMLNLQHHKSASDASWSPDHAIAGADVCMHFGFGPIRINQTTGSMVSELDATRPVHWLSGTAAPCLSLFKPVWMDAGLPDQGYAPTGIYDSRTIWWEGERLHRTVVEDYAARRQVFIAERDAMQTAFLNRVDGAAGASAQERLILSTDCLAQSRLATRRWAEQVSQLPYQKKAGSLYLTAWKKINLEGKYVGF
jgi:dipeptidase